jgi:heme exporter protein CcmD
MSDHAEYIIAAYAFTGAVVLVLIVWSYVSYRSQSTALARLEARLGRKDAE